LLSHTTVITMGGGLSRKIGLFGLTASGVGMILGAGIYALIGRAAGVAGNSVWISFLIGALISSFTGLSYAELSSMIPRAAAEVSYAREAFKGDLAPFLIGWIIIFTETVSASTVALGFGGYFKGIFGTPVVFSSLILIIILSLVNSVGIEESSRINIVFTIIEASGLLLVIILGVPYLGRVNYLEASEGLSGILKASTLIFFAYLGFEDIVNLAEESKSPELKIPKALILSVIITALFYVLVALAAVSLADWQELGSSYSPLAFAASKSLGQSAFLTMSVIALFATSNTVLILLIVTSRMIYGMARDGFLPHNLSKVSRRGTPWIAILIVMALSSIFILFGNIEFVAEITNFGTFIVFASVNLSNIWLRYRKPEWRRPFKTPLTIGRLPLIPILGLLSCGLMVTQFQTDILALSAIILFTGIITQRVLTKIRAKKSKEES
jgi:APA family basic amino acid/polyamine antiporter